MDHRHKPWDGNFVARFIFVALSGFFDQIGGCLRRVGC